MRLADASETNTIKPLFELYEAAFPANEKMSQAKIMTMYQDGQCHLLSMIDDDEFVGLAIISFCQKVTYLAYLAILPQLRGKGYGSQTLTQLQDKYPNLLLEIESTYHPQSHNFIQRKKRKRFYLKNNLKPLNYTVSCYGVEMELMTTVPNFRYQHYENIYHEMFGLKETRQNIKLHRILLPERIQA